MGSEASIDVLCAVCGGAVTASVHGTQHHEDLTCTCCGSAIDLRSAEVRSACERAQRVWLAEREQEAGGSAGEASWATRRALAGGLSSMS